MQISFFSIVIAYQHSESLFDFELVQNTLERSSPNILSAFSNPTQSLHALFINLNNPMKWFDKHRSISYVNVRLKGIPATKLCFDCGLTRDMFEIEC